MVTINLESTCNQNCVFCQRNRFYDRLKSPTTAEVKRLMRTSKDRSGIQFIGGGEPTMREDLSELIGYAREQGFKDIILETNGVKLSDPVYLSSLKNAGLTHCAVSLHSHIEKISDLITGAPGTFRKTLEALNNLSREEIGVSSLLFTINSLNSGSMREFLDFIKQNFPSIKTISFCFLRPIMDDGTSRRCTPKFSDIELEVYNAIEYGKKLEFRISMGIIPLCYLPGHENLSASTNILFRKDKKSFDRDIIHPEENSKVECCKLCYLNELCTGISKSYLSIYGDTEFYPLFISPQSIINRG